MIAHNNENHKLNFEEDQHVNNSNKVSNIYF